MLKTQTKPELGNTQQGSKGGYKLINGSFPPKFPRKYLSV